jgi:hypothetical protein
VLYTTAASPQVKDGGNERRHRKDDVCVFNWHPVESLPFAASGYESITKSATGLPLVGSFGNRAVLKYGTRDLG